MVAERDIMEENQTKKNKLRKLNSLENKMRERSFVFRFRTEELARSSPKRDSNSTHNSPKRLGSRIEWEQNRVYSKTS